MPKADLSSVHKHRVKFSSIGGAAGAVALATIALAAGSMRTPTIQSSASQVQPDEHVSLDIVASPVIEPIPVFFVGTGDGSNGSYGEPPTR